jgi:HAD superfamily hydrolase (TIGR01509 family)
MIVLFDFDGVIADTESQYTIFWDKQGKDYLGLESFGHTIKGQTLVQIFDKYFNGMLKEQEMIVPDLNAFEKQMSYDYIPGALEFLKDLKNRGIRTAIVTSSNDIKMSNAYASHPELLELVDAVLTSEHFSKSKPDPECFLKGMEVLGATPQETIVFEDSFHGISAGRSSGAFVVGLATTNKSEALAPLCDMVIDDFTSIDADKLSKLLHKPQTQQAPQG